MDGRSRAMGEESSCGGADGARPRPQQPCPPAKRRKVAGAGAEAASGHLCIDLTESDETLAVAKANGSASHAIDLLLIDDEEPKPKKQPAKAPAHSPHVPVPPADLSRTFRLNSLPSAASNVGACSLADIIEGDIQSAVLFTYKLDLMWLLDEVPVLQTIPLTISHMTSPEELPERVPGNVRLWRPRMLFPYGVNHGKIFCLFYEKHVRIAVSTANLLEVDYERKANGIWMQDFPLAAPAAKTDCDFLRTLVDYVRRQGLKKTSEQLGRYDYTSATVVLVTSVPGRHSRNSAGDFRYGHMKVRALLQAHCERDNDVEAEEFLMQASSFGSLSEKWLRGELLESFSSGVRGSFAPTARIVWPCVEYVRRSIDGYQAGGSLCLSAKNLKPHVRERMCLYKDGRENRRARNITPHIKTYVCLAKGSDDLRWMLLTSANVSGAAWGTLQKNGTELFMRHYEMGVLFLPKLLGRRCRLGGAASATEGEVVLPCPYARPPPPYDHDKDSPWVWDLPRRKPDVLGNTWLT